MNVLRPTILIIDDEYDICIALHDFLMAKGYDVRISHTGEDGIANAQANRFDAVILDLGLPDQDGMAVLQVLNRLDATLPIIVLTAFSKSEKAVDSLSRGSFAYLVKPYNRDELLAILARAVGMRALSTEAERTEAALTESEGRFRAVVQSAAEAIICADQHGCIIFWNKAAERLFGYTEQEALRQPLLLIMPARYRDAHLSRMKQFEQTGEASVIERTLEVEGLHKDGKEFPIELSVGTWTTKEALCYSAIVRDVTERKRWESELRRQQIEQQALLDLIPAMVWYKDCRNRILRANRAAAESINKTISQVEGKATHDLYPEDAEKYYQDDLDVIQSGRPKLGIVERYPTATGRVRWVQTDKVPYRDTDGTIVGVLVFAQDITERRQAEEALRESEERFRQVVENIREVFWVSDPQKEHVLYISPGYEEIWGRSCASLYAAPRSWLDSVHPDDRARVTDATMTKQVDGSYNEEYRIIRPDGSIRWIWDRAFPIRDRTGSVYRLTGLAEDITERKQREGLAGGAEALRGDGF